MKQVKSKTVITSAARKMLALEGLTSRSKKAKSTAVEEIDSALDCVISVLRNCSSPKSGTLHVLSLYLGQTVQQNAHKIHIQLMIQELEIFLLRMV